MNKKAGHGLGPTRARVLRHLAGIDGGAGVLAVSQALDLHSNTARFHLEALVESGYARRGLERRQGQGRPRTLYHATEEAPVVETSHLRDLTQVLVQQLILQAPDPDAVAEDVGRTWGREISQTGAAALGKPGPEQREAGLQVLLDHTVGMGFTLGRPDEETVTFHSCPYRGVQQPVLASICRVHLGMMRGYLDSTGSDLEVDSLQPGVVCVATLSPGTGGDPAAQPSS